MQIVVLGLNHKTAPLEIREKFYLNEEKISDLTSELKRRGIREVVFLSTCNRTEVYLFSEEPEVELALVKDSLREFLKVDESILNDHTYRLYGEDAYRHLLFVACGLDSMVIGEPQILGQVKEAYRIATFNNSTGFFSNKIFHRVFSVAKRVRTETKIGYNPLSVSSMACEMAKKIFGNLKEKKILTIGAGEMTKIALKHFKKEGIAKVYIVNRTFSNAKKLAEEIVGEALPFSEMERLLTEVDLILTSTGSQEFILKKETVLKAMRIRKFKPLFIIDIALPRDVDPDVNDIENVYLFNIDDLKELSEKHLKDRMNEAQRAKEIIEEETKKLPLILDHFDTKPLIIHMINYAETMRKNEVKKALKKIESPNEALYETLDYLTRSIVKKLLHPYIELVKRNPDFETIERVKKLFRFEKNEEEAYCRNERE
ncbi:MAG: glutamyl-tRNA reductase [Desulfobacterota bacterium]|nr:glutamyl-tRNA reductase [Thermodesulfobacteriota bacterium]MDW8002078.1 glutamyl-tRNA reductase [Deltaproteobacteria bacterium]